MKVWRICKAEYSSTAFSGEGARLYAARWNPEGVAMVYTSPTLPLAAMEVFVHLEPLAEPGDLVSIAAELPLDEDECERLALASLPADWRRERHPVLRAIGAAWAQSQRSLVLLVPSVVFEGEWNALVNPAHPDATKIKVAAAKPFRFDERMFR
jgi:RES domain-containing protein